MDKRSTVHERRRTGTPVKRTGEIMKTTTERTTIANRNSRKLELRLDDPALSPPPDYEQEPETDASHATKTSNHESIYDYLDALETQSERQLHSARGKKVATMAIELSDKTKTIELLKLARKKDRAKTKQLVAGEEAKLQTQLKEQQLRFDKELEKHLDFAQNVVSDKAELAKRCDELLAELQKANATATREADRFKLQLKDAKERWSAQERVRREQWIAKKTEEIKKATVKALEPDIQAILLKGKADLEKAQDAAAEERRKLQAQLEKAADAALQRQKDDFERKLVEAREKERAKLMTRLDAADAELQQQLSSQRRRLQEEAEVARGELFAELRAAKVAQAKELEELKLLEAARTDKALARFQREKEEVARKYEAELMALREQTSVECEQFKAQLAAKLRKEAERERHELEKQLLASRDAKIEVVIEKLQEESRAAIARAELKVQSKLDAERKEWERKLKQTSEVEGVWMDKNRELHEKVARLELAREQLRAQADELGGDARRAAEKAAELARLLHEERRQHESSVQQLEHRCSSLQQDSEFARQQQCAEFAALRERLESGEANFQAQLRRQQSEHESALASLHERVRASIARKEQVIASLQEELRLALAKLDKSNALIEEQRLQLFAE
ncbi:hypothetical protein PybrP1_004805 [[Pythium] brassicae (nom. inval.)]|nr:hypothetical protein PybrP1_004805 [[Pythium] brassicae (nom. inval.)]